MRAAAPFLSLSLSFSPRRIQRCVSLSLSVFISQPGCVSSPSGGCSPAAAPAASKIKENEKYEDDNRVVAAPPADDLSRTSTGIVHVVVVVVAVR